MARRSGLTAWLSAPVRLVRSKWIALPLVVVAALGGPALVLDQSSSQAAGNASLAADLDVCPFSVGLSTVREVAVPGSPTDSGQPARRGLEEITSALDTAVGAAASGRVVTIFGGTVDLVDPATGKKVPVQLVSRTGSETHVVPARSPGSSGLLVQKMVLPQLGVDRPVPVQLVDGGLSVALPIAAVVSDLSSGVAPSFWCSLNPQIYGSDGVNETPLAIVDQASLLQIESKLQRPTITVEWEYPPSPTNWNLAVASRTLAKYRSISKDAANPDGKIDTEIGDGPAPTSDQTNTLATAREQETAAQGAVRPFTSAALLTLVIALAICVAAWLEVGRSGRRTLVRHGVGVPGIALKSVLELLSPVVAGFLLGVLGSWFVARWKLPQEAHSWLTGVQSSDRLLVALVVPFVVIVAASLIDAIGVVRPREQRRVWLLPAGLFAAVVATGFSIYTFRQRVDTSRAHRTLLGSDNVASLAAVAIAAVVSMVLVCILISTPTRRLLDRSWSVIWLAWRRLGSDQSIRSVIACVALALAIVHVVSANIAAIAQTAETRQAIQVGAASAYVLNDSPTQTALAKLPIPVTVVTKLSESSALAIGKEPLVVIGVDPTTFATQAYWRDGFSDDSLRKLLGKISDPSDPLAAIVVGGDVPDRFQVTLPGETGNIALHLHTVAHARFFPGEDTIGQRSLVIVNRFTLLKAGVTGGTQLWSASSNVQTAEQLTADGFSVTRIDLASAEPLNGVDATKTALRDARRISIGALGAAVLSMLAWLVSRHRRSLREVRLLQMIGVRTPNVVLITATQALFGGVLTLVTALVAGEAVNRILPVFVDQSPFLDPPAERAFVAAPWELAGAVLVAALIAIAGVTRARLGRSRGDAELVHDG
ncbi:MAG: transporter permease [Ilumatobacteraceae bacterium]|nr:transporter permease [Ilumatobacteraceae bacterium]